MLIQKKKRYLLSALIFLFLCIGTGVGFILLKNSQDNRQQASGACKAGDPYCSCDSWGSNCVVVDSNGVRETVKKGSEENNKGILATSYTGERPTEKAACNSGVWMNEFCYMPGDEIAGGYIVVKSGRHDYPYLEQTAAYESLGFGAKTVTEKLGTTESLGNNCGGKGQAYGGVCYAYGSVIDGYLVMPARTSGCNDSTGDYCYAHLEKIEVSYSDWQTALSAYEKDGNLKTLEDLYKKTYGISFNPGALYDPKAPNATLLKTQALLSALTSAEVLQKTAAEQNKELDKKGSLTKEEQATYDFNKQIINSPDLAKNYQILDQLNDAAAQKITLNNAIQKMYSDLVVAGDNTNLSNLATAKFKEIFGYDPSSKYGDVNGILGAFGIDPTQLNKDRENYVASIEKQKEDVDKLNQEYQGYVGGSSQNINDLKQAALDAGLVTNDQIKGLSETDLLALLLSKFSDTTLDKAKQEAATIVTARETSVKEQELTKKYLDNQNSVSSISDLRTLYKIYVGHEPDSKTNIFQMREEIAKHNSQIALSTYAQTQNISYLNNYLKNNTDLSGAALSKILNDPKALLNNIYGAELGGQLYKDIVVPNRFNEAMKSFSDDKGASLTAFCKELGVTDCNITDKNATATLSLILDKMYEGNNDVSIPDLAASYSNQIISNTKDDKQKTILEIINEGVITGNSSQVAMYSGTDTAYDDYKSNAADLDTVTNEYRTAVEAAEIFNASQAFSYATENRAAISNYTWGLSYGNALMEDDIFNREFTIKEMDLNAGQSISLTFNQITSQVANVDVAQNIATNYATSKYYDYTGPADTKISDVALKGAENLGVLDYNYQSAEAGYYTEKTLNTWGEKIGELATKAGAAYAASQMNQAAITNSLYIDETYTYVDPIEYAKQAGAEFTVDYHENMVNNLYENYVAGAEKNGVDKVAFEQFIEDPEVQRSSKELDYERLQKVVAPAAAVVVLPALVISGVGIPVILGAASSAFSLYQGAGMKAQALEIQRIDIDTRENAMVQSYIENGASETEITDLKESLNTQVETLNKQGNLMLANSAVAAFTSAGGFLTSIASTANAANAASSTVNFLTTSGQVLTKVGQVGGIAMNSYNAVNSGISSYNAFAAGNVSEGAMSALSSFIAASGVAGNTFGVLGPTTYTNKVDYILDAMNVPAGAAVDAQQVSQACFGSSEAFSKEDCTNAWIGLALSAGQNVSQISSSVKNYKADLAAGKLNVDADRVADIQKQIDAIDTEVLALKTNNKGLNTGLQINDLALQRTTLLEQIANINPNVKLAGNSTEDYLATGARISLDLETKAQAAIDAGRNAEAERLIDQAGIYKNRPLEAAALKDQIASIDEQITKKGLLLSNEEVTDLQTKRNDLTNKLETVVKDLSAVESMQKQSETLLQTAKENTAFEELKKLQAVDTQKAELVKIYSPNSDDLAKYQTKLGDDNTAAKLETDSSERLKSIAALQDNLAKLNDLEVQKQALLDTSNADSEIGRETIAKLDTEISNLKKVTDTVSADERSFVQKIADALSPNKAKNEAYYKSLDLAREAETIKTKLNSPNTAESDTQNLKEQLADVNRQLLDQKYVLANDAANPSKNIIQRVAEIVPNMVANRQINDLKNAAKKLGTNNLKLAENIANKQTEIEKLKTEDATKNQEKIAKLETELADLSKTAQNYLKGETALINVNREGDFTEYIVTKAGEKAGIKQKQLDILNKELAAFEDFRRQGQTSEEIEKNGLFKIYSGTDSFKDQDIFLLAEVEAFGSGQRGTVFGALPGMGKTDVVMPFNILLKQRLTNEPQFVVFPEAKLMKPWVSDASYTPNKTFIDYVESRFGEGSVLIVKANDPNVDPAAIAKAKFVITTKDVAFDLQNTDTQVGLALRNKWKNSFVHADEVDWTFNPNENYKLSGTQTALTEKSEFSLYLDAQKQVLGIDEKGNLSGQGLSSLRNLVNQLETSKSIPDGIVRTSDGKSGKFADAELEKQVLSEWLGTWNGQSKIAGLDMSADITTVRQKINNYLSTDTDAQTHNRRAELAMINETVNFLSRVPGEDYGLTTNTKMNGNNEEVINSIAPKEQNRDTGRSYSAVAESLLYNTLGARVVGANGQIDLAKLTVGENGSDINYALLMLESKGFSLYTGTPETVAKLYKMAYGIELKVFTDSAVDDSVRRFKESDSKVFTDLESQIAARLEEERDQVFVNMVSGLRSNEATLKDLVTKVSAIDAGNVMYEKLMLIGANGKLTEYNLVAGELEYVREFASTDDLNARTTELNNNDQLYIKFYEYGAHVGVDTKNNVDVSRAVGLCKGCDETTFAQGINRLRVQVVNDPNNAGKLITKSAPMDVVWLDAPTGKTDVSIDDFAVAIKDQQVINEALAEVSFKETLLKNSVDATFADLVDLAKNGKKGLLGFGAYKADQNLVTQLEVAQQKWKETSQMNYMLGADDLSAQAKLEKTASQVAGTYEELSKLVAGSGEPAKLLAKQADGAIGDKAVKLAFSGDDDYEVLGEKPSYRQIVELINQSSKHLENVDIAFTNRSSQQEVVQSEIAKAVDDAQTNTPTRTTEENTNQNILQRAAQIISQSVNSTTVQRVIRTPVNLVSSAFNAITGFFDSEEEIAPEAVAPEVVASKDKAISDLKITDESTLASLENLKTTEEIANFVTERQAAYKKLQDQFAALNTVKPAVNNEEDYKAQNDKLTETLATVQDLQNQSGLAFITIADDGSISRVNEDQFKNLSTFKTKAEAQAEKLAKAAAEKAEQEKTTTESEKVEPLEPVASTIVETIGTDGNNSLQTMPGITTVAKKHAEVIKDGDGNLYIRDLSTRNGTYINGQKIEANKNILLHENDTLFVGNPENSAGITFKVAKNNNSQLDLAPSSSIFLIDKDLAAVSDLNNFDPVAGLDSLYESSRSDRPAMIAKYKENLILQKQGIASTQDFVISTIEKNPDTNIYRFIEEVKVYALNKGLNLQQIETVVNSIRLYESKEQRAKEILSLSDNPKVLFEKAFGFKPIGKIQVKRFGNQVVFYAKSVDVGRADRRSDSRPIDSSEGAFVRLIKNNFIFAKNLATDYFTGSAIGGFQTTAAKIPNSKNQIIVINSSYSESEEVLRHEFRHSIIGLLSETGVFGESISKAEVVKKLSKASDSGNTNEFNQIANEFLYEVRKNAENNFANEFAATIVGSIKGKINFSKRLNLFSTLNFNSLYKHVARDKKYYESKNFYEYYLEDRDYIKSYLNLVNKYFGFKAQITLTNDAINAYNALIDKGYSQEEAFAILQSVRVDHWMKNANRMPSLVDAISSDEKTSSQANSEKAKLNQEENDKRAKEETDRLALEEANKIEQERLAQEAVNKLAAEQLALEQATYKKLQDQFAALNTVKSVINNQDDYQAQTEVLNETLSTIKNLQDKSGLKFIEIVADGTVQRVNKDQFANLSTFKTKAEAQIKKLAQEAASEKVEQERLVVGQINTPEQAIDLVKNNFNNSEELFNNYFESAVALGAARKNSDGTYEVNKNKLSSISWSTNWAFLNHVKQVVPDSSHIVNSYKEMLENGEKINYEQQQMLINNLLDPNVKIFFDKEGNPASFEGYLKSIYGKMVEIIRVDIKAFTKEEIDEIAKLITKPEEQKQFLEMVSHEIISTIVVKNGDKEIEIPIISLNLTNAKSAGEAVIQIAESPHMHPIFINNLLNKKPLFEILTTIAHETDHVIHDLVNFDPSVYRSLAKDMSNEEVSLYFDSSNYEPDINKSLYERYLENEKVRYKNQVNDMQRIDDTILEMGGDYAAVRFLKFFADGMSKGNYPESLALQNSIENMVSRKILRRTELAGHPDSSQYAVGMMLGHVLEEKYGSDEFFRILNGIPLIKAKSLFQDAIKEAEKMLGDQSYLITDVFDEIYDTDEPTVNINLEQIKNNQTTKIADSVSIVEKVRGAFINSVEQLKIFNEVSKIETKNKNKMFMITKKLHEVAAYLADQNIPFRDYVKSHPQQNESNEEAFVEFTPHLDMLFNVFHDDLTEEIFSSEEVRRVVFEIAYHRASRRVGELEEYSAELRNLTSSLDNGIFEDFDRYTGQSFELPTIFDEEKGQEVINLSEFESLKKKIQLIFKYKELLNNKTIEVDLSSNPDFDEAEQRFKAALEAAGLTYEPIQTSSETDKLAAKQLAESQRKLTVRWQAIGDFTNKVSFILPQSVSASVLQKNISMINKLIMVNQDIDFSGINTEENIFVRLSLLVNQFTDSLKERNELLMEARSLVADPGKVSTLENLSIEELRDLIAQTKEDIQNEEGTKNANLRLDADEISSLFGSFDFSSDTDFIDLLEKARNINEKLGDEEFGYEIRFNEKMASLGEKYGIDLSLLRPYADLNSLLALEEELDSYLAQLKAWGIEEVDGYNNLAEMFIRYSDNSTDFAEVMRNVVLKDYQKVTAKSQLSYFVTNEDGQFLDANGNALELDDVSKDRLPVKKSVEEGGYANYKDFSQAAEAKSLAIKRERILDEINFLLKTSLAKIPKQENLLKLLMEEGSEALTDEIMKNDSFTWRIEELDKLNKQASNKTTARQSAIDFVDSWLSEHPVLANIKEIFPDFSPGMVNKDSSSLEDNLKQKPAYNAAILGSLISYDSNSKIIEVNLDDIIGSSSLLRTEMPEANNWWDVLIHRDRIHEWVGKTIENGSDSALSGIEIMEIGNGKYAVGGDGNTRIALLKALGVKTAKLEVRSSNILGEHLITKENVDVLTERKDQGLWTGEIYQENGSYYMRVDSYANPWVFLAGWETLRDDFNVDISNVEKNSNKSSGKASNSVWRDASLETIKGFLGNPFERTKFVGQLRNLEAKTSNYSVFRQNLDLSINDMEGHKKFLASGISYDNGYSSYSFGSFRERISSDLLFKLNRLKNELFEDQELNLSIDKALSITRNILDEYSRRKSNGTIKVTSEDVSKTNNLISELNKIRNKLSANKSASMARELISDISKFDDTQYSSFMKILETHYSEINPGKLNEKNLKTLYDEYPSIKRSAIDFSENYKDFLKQFNQLIAQAESMKLGSSKYSGRTYGEIDKLIIERQEIYQQLRKDFLKLDVDTKIGDEYRLQEKLADLTKIIEQISAQEDKTGKKFFENGVQKRVDKDGNLVGYKFERANFAGSYTEFIKGNFSEVNEESKSEENKNVDSEEAGAEKTDKEFNSLCSDCNQVRLDTQAGVEAANKLMEEAEKYIEQAASEEEIGFLEEAKSYRLRAEKYKEEALIKLNDTRNKIINSHGMQNQCVQLYLNAWVDTREAEIRNTQADIDSAIDSVYKATVTAKDLLANGKMVVKTGDILGIGGENETIDLSSEELNNIDALLVGDEGTVSLREMAQFADVDGQLDKNQVVGGILQSLKDALANNEKSKVSLSNAWAIVRVFSRNANTSLKQTLNKDDKKPTEDSTKALDQNESTTEKKEGIQISGEKPEGFFMNALDIFSKTGPYGANILQYYPTSLVKSTFWDPKTTVLSNGRPTEILASDYASQKYKQLISSWEEDFSIDTRDKAQQVMEDAGYVGHSITGWGADQEIQGLISIMKGGLWPEKGMPVPWAGSFTKSGIGATAGDFFGKTAVVIADSNPMGNLDQYLVSTDRGDSSRFVPPSKLIFIVPNESSKNALSLWLEGNDTSILFNDSFRTREFKDEILSSIVTLEEVTQGKVATLIFKKEYFNQILATNFDVEALHKEANKEYLGSTMEYFFDNDLIPELWKQWQEVAGNKDVSQVDKAMFNEIMENALANVEKNVESHTAYNATGLAKLLLTDDSRLEMVFFLRERLDKSIVKKSFSSLCSDCNQVRLDTQAGVEIADSLTKEAEELVKQADIARTANNQDQAADLSNQAQAKQQEALDQLNNTRFKVVNSHGMQNQCVQLYLNAWVDTREAVIRNTQTDVDKAINSVFQATVIAENLLADGAMEITTNNGFLGIGKQKETVTLSLEELNDVNDLLKGNAEENIIGLKEMAQFDQTNGQSDKTKVTGGILGQLKNSVPNKSLLPSIKDRARVFSRSVGTSLKKSFSKGMSQSRTNDISNNTEKANFFNDTRVKISNFFYNTFFKEKVENSLDIITSYGSHSTQNKKRYAWLIINLFGDSSTATSLAESILEYRLIDDDSANAWKIINKKGDANTADVLVNAIYGGSLNNETLTNAVNFVTKDDIGNVYIAKILSSVIYYDFLTGDNLTKVINFVTRKDINDNSIVINLADAISKGRLTGDDLTNAWKLIDQKGNAGTAVILAGAISNSRLTGSNITNAWKVINEKGDGDTARILVDAIFSNNHLTANDLTNAINFVTRDDVGGAYVAKTLISAISNGRLTGNDLTNATNFAMMKDLSNSSAVNSLADAVSYARLTGDDLVNAWKIIDQKGDADTAKILIDAISNGRLTGNSLINAFNFVTKGDAHDESLVPSLIYVISHGRLNSDDLTNAVNFLMRDDIRDDSVLPALVSAIYYGYLPGDSLANVVNFLTRDNVHNDLVLPALINAISSGNLPSDNLNTAINFVIRDDVRDNSVLPALVSAISNGRLTGKSLDTAINFVIRDDLRDNFVAAAHEKNIPGLNLDDIINIKSLREQILNGNSNISVELQYISDILSREDINVDDKGMFFGKITLLVFGDDVPYRVQAPAKLTAWRVYRDVQKGSPITSRELLNLIYRAKAAIQQQLNEISQDSLNIPVGYRVSIGNEIEVVNNGLSRTGSFNLGDYIEYKRLLNQLNSAGISASSIIQDQLDLYKAEFTYDSVNQAKNVYREVANKLPEMGIGRGKDGTYEFANYPVSEFDILVWEYSELERLGFLSLNPQILQWIGERGIHITVSGEKGVNLDENAILLQNSLLMTGYTSAVLNGQAGIQDAEEKDAKSTDIAGNKISTEYNIAKGLYLVPRPSITDTFTGNFVSGVEFRVNAISSLQNLQKTLRAYNRLSIPLMTYQNALSNKEFDEKTLLKDINNFIGDSTLFKSVILNGEENKFLLPTIDDPLKRKLILTWAYYKAKSIFNFEQYQISNILPSPLKPLVSKTLKVMDGELGKVFPTTEEGTSRLLDDAFASFHRQPPTNSLPGQMQNLVDEVINGIDSFPEFKSVVGTVAYSDKVLSIQGLNNCSSCSLRVNTVLNQLDKANEFLIKGNIDEAINIISQARNYVNSHQYKNTLVQDIQNKDIEVEEVGIVKTKAEQDDALKAIQLIIDRVNDLLKTRKDLTPEQITALNTLKTELETEKTTVSNIQVKPSSLLEYLQVDKQNILSVFRRLTYAFNSGSRQAEDDKLEQNYRLTYPLQAKTNKGADNFSFDDSGKAFAAFHWPKIDLTKIDFSKFRTVGGVISSFTANGFNAIGVWFKSLIKEESITVTTKEEPMALASVTPAVSITVTTTPTPTPTKSPTPTPSPSLTPSPTPKDITSDLKEESFWQKLMKGLSDAKFIANLKFSGAILSFDPIMRAFNMIPFIIDMKKYSTELPQYDPDSEESQGLFYSGVYEDYLCKDGDTYLQDLTKTADNLVKISDCQNSCYKGACLAKVGDSCTNEDASHVFAAKSNKCLLVCESGKLVESNTCGNVRVGAYSNKAYWEVYQSLSSIPKQVLDDNKVYIYATWNLIDRGYTGGYFRESPFNPIMIAGGEANSPHTVVHEYFHQWGGQKQRWYPDWAPFAWSINPLLELINGVISGSDGDNAPRDYENLLDYKVVKYVGYNNEENIFHYGEDKYPTVRYGTLNPEEICIDEDFADSAALYVTDSCELSGLSPIRYNYFKNKVFNGVEYVPEYGCFPYGNKYHK